MRFSCFPVLPGSAEAQVIWGGTLKRFCLLTLSVTFLPKKYQNAFTCVKVIANQRWDDFETQCRSFRPEFTPTHHLHFTWQGGHPVRQWAVELSIVASKSNNYESSVKSYTFLFVEALLWSPYVIGKTIIFLPCGFYFLSSFLFPRLISAVGDWMSTILPHMV